jgi:hypothetical protein
MPLDLATLRAEIALPQYAGLDEPAIAGALNARTIDGSRDVPAFEARQIVLLSGEWAKIKLLAEERPASTAISVAMTFVDALSDRETVLPAGNRAHIAGLLDVLVAANVLSGASKAALMLLFAAKISRAEELFGRGARVDSGDISRAKAGDA